MATLVTVANRDVAPLGSSLLITGDGAFYGNIGAGCHEGDIIAAAEEALHDRTSTLHKYGLFDPILDGSACGAELGVVAWRPNDQLLPVFDVIANGTVPATLVIPSNAGLFEIDVPRKKRILLVGATSLADAVRRIARTADIECDIVDPRPAFCSKLRFPRQDVINEWPDRLARNVLLNVDAIVIVSHDSKIDVPALRVALASRIPYVGLLGSRQTQREHRATLRSEGYDERAINGIRGPVGLDIGSTTVESIAISIIAEMIAVWNDRQGSPLTFGDGPIHTRASIPSSV